jgi:cell division protein FtsW
MVSRTERTPFAAWWWTVDRLALLALVTLMLAGIVLSLAASPPVALRLKLDAFYFVNRHVLYFLLALLIMMATSFLTPRQIRRAALAVFVVSFALVIAAFWGPEIKGAHRWITVLGVTVQPSEFLKPAFVVLIAWLFSESARHPDMPTNTMALGLLASVIAVLVLQPDFGQTMLIALVWGALFFMSGMRLVWVAGLAAAGLFGLTAAYFVVPHVGRRLQGFFDPNSGDTFQIDTAVESFVRGGWFGRGPGEGTMKRVLPDSHTDFVFAVGAEEFGIALCLVLVMLFAFIVLRALTRAMSDRDGFVRFGSAGLAILFGMQSAINMAVNIALIPEKGITLPFISYGGSSMLSLAYSMGMLLALMRERPRADLIATPPGPGMNGSPA